MKTTRYALLLSLSLATAAQAADETPAELWTAKCKSCHGPDGRAQTQMGKKEAIVDMSQAAWQKAQTDEDIREVISEGSSRNRKMKPYKEKLTPEQINSLVGYIRTFKKG
ncbi:c-type cytochrome [Archangium sp.]|uniref:c-type cytochrome n=1 Tax=Archangium sp. TaxID=1872627 RepID=UPI00389AB321